MANPYESAINKLKARRETNPYLAGARSQIGHLSRKYNDLGSQLDTSLKTSGSASSRAQATQNVARQYGEDIGTVYESVDSQLNQRNRDLSAKITDLEVKNEQYKEQEKAKSLASEKGMWKLGGQLVGAVAGAFAGDPIMGAQVGGVAGNIAGSFAGDEFDVNMAAEGVLGAVQSYQNISGLMENNEINELNKVSANLIPTNMTDAQTNQFETILAKSNMYSNPKERSEFLNRSLSDLFKPLQVDPELQRYANYQDRN